MIPAPPHPDRDCIWLLRRGMSVLCIDSYDPPRKNCDHCVSPQCFAPHTTTPSEQDKQEKFVTDAITFACEKHDDEIRDNMLDKFKEIIRLHDEDELLYPDLYNEFLVIYKSLRTPTEAHR